MTNKCKLLNELLKGFKKSEDMLGDGDKKISEAEIQMGIAARRSIVAMRDLPAGTVLTVKDLDCIRPHNGLPPSEVNSLIGKKLVAAVKYHDLLLDVSIQKD